MTPSPSATTFHRPWPELVRAELRIWLGTAFGVAGFLKLVFNDSFSANLIYALCIGGMIQGSIEIGRYAMAAWLIKHHPYDEGLRTHDWPGWACMLPWTLVCAPAGYYLGSQLGDWFTGFNFHNDVKHGSMRSVILGVAAIVAISLSITYFFYSRGRIATTEAQAQAAQRAAAETQLKLLQSQLEPHMLFNTLANLRVLIGIDPARAQGMLDHLIAYLRATLSASRTNSHPLSDEFDRTADYLALMAIRMGPRLQLELNLPAELRALPVPPLLLQPLVENCIHHGLEPKVEGGRITISAQQIGTNLRLSVRDTGVGLHNAPTSEGSGFGTQQVRDRLNALFGTQATLTLSAATEAEGGTLAEITMPLPATMPTSTSASTPPHTHPATPT